MTTRRIAISEGLAAKMGHEAVVRRENPPIRRYEHSLGRYVDDPPVLQRGPPLTPAEQLVYAARVLVDCFGAATTRLAASAHAATEAHERDRSHVDLVGMIRALARCAELLERTQERLFILDDRAQAAKHPAVIAELILSLGRITEALTELGKYR